MKICNHRSLTYMSLLPTHLLRQHPPSRPMVWGAYPCVCSAFGAWPDRLLCGSARFGYGHLSGDAFGVTVPGGTGNRRRSTGPTRNELLGNAFADIPTPGFKEWLRLPYLPILEAAGWADLHPACFSDGAMFSVYALREAATGRLTTTVWSIEMFEQLLTDIRSTQAK